MEAMSNTLRLEGNISDLRKITGSGTAWTGINFILFFSP